LQNISLTEIFGILTQFELEKRKSNVRG